MDFDWTLPFTDVRLVTHPCRQMPYCIFGGEPTDAKRSVGLHSTRRFATKRGTALEQQQLIANPFALLLNPEAVHAALQQSTALNRLRSRIWRPLDRTSGPLVGEEPPSDSSTDDHDPLIDD
jgi:hypothetical protein